MKHPRTHAPVPAPAHTSMLAPKPASQHYGRFPASPITYYGGKKRLALEIVSLMPRHSIYCEPYFGGGAVFFAKRPSYLEAINDLNDNLINFYKICQADFGTLREHINTLLYSESLWQWSKQVYNAQIEATPIERAVATFLVFNLSINSNPVAGWRFDNGTGGSHVAIVFKHKIDNFCPWIQNRLRNVQISCRDALKVIQERDTPDTLFYLDPPYLNADQGHYAGFTPTDMQNLLEILSNIKGRFMLSNYPSEILEQYLSANKWMLKEFQLKKDITNGHQATYKTEWLVANFPLQYPHNNLFTSANIDF